MKVLAIGAHFDDIELGCGGTLVRHSKNGDEIYLLVVTNSSYSSKVVEHTRMENEALDEGKRSAKFLKATLINGGFETLTLSPSKDLINYLCEQVSVINPQVVYTHFIGDQHLDHQAVAKASLIATRNVNKVLAYMSNVYDTLPVFTPNYYVDISEYFNDKLKLIDYFDSEKETHLDWKRQIENLNGLYGVKNRKEYVEAYEIIRIMEDDL